MKLFHLSPLEFAISNVAMRRLKVSRIGDLNDPFELLPINTRNKLLRQVASATRDEINSTTGVLCFSRSWANPVLWSHYADKHRGVALGFEVADEYAMPVSYVEKLQRIEANQLNGKVDLTEDFSRMLLTTKFSDWRYESECRIFVDLDHSTAENGLYFADFNDKMRLSDIVLGARCATPIEKVRELVRNYPQPVHVLRSRMAFTKFAVVEDRRFRAKA